MNKRTGHYVTIHTKMEPFKAFIPPTLPPIPPINMDVLYPHLDKATKAISELNGMTSIIPNISLFIYMYVRKEALLSSQIEGTQSSFSDLILFENEQKTEVSVEDVEEVSHYVSAISHGLKRLKHGFPLCLRLLKEMHAILLTGSRGSTKSPGNFRRSQNWIGGTRPGNALFVPPPPEELPDILSNFENFLHTDNLKIPTLIMAGFAHLQFESIHPFLDGNGRLGRLLIILLLCNGNLLQEPVLYISLYLKKNRQTYYRLLQEVRTNGTWETWLEFFLEGITSTATNTMATMQKMNQLFDQNLEQINTLGRAKLSCIDTLNTLKQLPQISVTELAKRLNISAPTARKALDNLIELDIVSEISHKQRDKIYTYTQYLKMLTDGAKPL